jgi:hypothetical protein
MKTLHIRLALLVFCAAIICVVVTVCKSLPECHSNRLVQRHHEKVTLEVIDKQQPGYSSGFRLGARRNVGMATLSSGHQFKFTCEFIRTDELADVYILDLTLPSGTNLVRRISFNGETQLIYETDKERIEIDQPTKPSTATE